MFNGLVKDSVALYAGVKMLKKSKKRVPESSGIFTNKFKADASQQIMDSLDKTQAKLEAFIAKKEMEIQARKTKVTK